MKCPEAINFIEELGIIPRGDGFQAFNYLRQNKHAIVKSDMPIPVVVNQYVNTDRNVLWDIFVESNKLFMNVKCYKRDWAGVGITTLEYELRVRVNTIPDWMEEKIDECVTDALEKQYEKHLIDEKNKWVKARYNELTSNREDNR